MRPTTSIGAMAPAANATPMEPRTAIEHGLRTVWEHVLQLDPIGVRDSFSDLGGTPSLWESLLAETAKAFGFIAEGLPVREIIDRPTIEGFARLIEENLQPTPSQLIPLQPRGTARPLFLIHAGGGYVYFYRALAWHLAPQHPVYAIRPEDSADGLGQPFHRCTSIEQLATRYIRLIRTAQSTGPYSLGGASFGGVVAFEIARQLRAQGEAVAPVLLFSAFVRNDASPAAGAEGSPIGPTPLQHRITQHLSHASTLPAREAVQYVSRTILKNRSEVIGAFNQVRGSLRDELMRRRHQGRHEALPPELVYRRSSSLKTGRRLVSMYTPGVLDGKIVLFRAADDRDPEPHWVGLARGGMDVHDVPGGHLTMMDEPVVAATARTVREYLA